MTATTIRVQMAQRKDTAANWTAANPILLSGEIGYETDTKKFKIGNGSTNWNSLAYLPIPDGSGNLTITGNLEIGSTGSLTFEGSTADGFETTLAVTNPTADRTITLPNQSGNVLVSGNASIIDADIAANAEIAVSKLADGTARQLLQTDAAGTGVEWTSNVDIPGTLDVTGAATFDAAVTVAGDLTVNGTTTTISTQNLLVEDKNIIIGDVASPTDVTADGGGITLKGATDKTINWVDATDAWTSSERFSVPLGTAALPSLTFTGDPNTGIYSPGADQVAISTGGSGRLFVDASGNVGVGTGGTQGTKLHVVGGNVWSGNFYEVGRFQKSSGTAISLGYDNSDYVATVGAYSHDGTPSNLSFWTYPGSGTIQERLRITSAGLVGIGTSSPGAQLDVYNSQASGISEVARLRWNNGGTGGALTYANQSGTVLGQIANVTSASGAELAFSTYSNSSALGERMRLTSTGLGIGVTNPGSRIDLAGPGIAGLQTVATFRTASGNAFGLLLKGNFTNEEWLIDNFYSGAIAVGMGGSEKLRIDSSGRVGIGTSSPGSLLDLVGGDIRLNSVYGINKSNEDGYIHLSGGTSNSLGGTIFCFGQSHSGNANEIHFRNSGNQTRVVIDSSGRVGIGTTSPAATLHLESSAGTQLRIKAGSTNDAQIDLIPGGQTNPFYIYCNSSRNLIFQDNATERARIDSSGRLLVGTSSARSNFYNDTNSAFIQLESASNDGSALALVQNFNANTLGGQLILAKSNATSVGSNTLVANNDTCGRVSFQGNDGAQFVEAAAIFGAIDGTPSANDMPGRLVFSTTAAGASSPTERVRIQADGKLIKYGDSTSARIQPQTDNAGFLGEATKRWEAVYAVNGTIQTSDIREKTEIVDSPLGADFIRSLRPVAYKWKIGGYTSTYDDNGEETIIPKPGVRAHYGFIAQEVKKAVGETDFGGWLQEDLGDPESQQSLRLHEFISPIVKALQEALDEIDNLKTEVAALKAQ